MSKLGFLFTAYAFIWTALFLFLLYIANKLANLEKKVKALQDGD